MWQFRNIWKRGISMNIDEKSSFELQGDPSLIQAEEDQITIGVTVTIE